jgi:hypothetical protein
MRKRYDHHDYTKEKLAAMDGLATLVFEARSDPTFCVAGHTQPRGEWPLARGFLLDKRSRKLRQRIYLFGQSRFLNRSVNLYSRFVNS